MKYFTILFFLCINQHILANNAAYEQRRQAYIDNALANLGSSMMVIQAYSQVPLDTGALDTLLVSIADDQNSDFHIIDLVRILYFTNGAYDSMILPVLNAVPYWVNSGDTVRTYWSENHMIMWMSSDWLLHERYGKPVDSNLRARLYHYLSMKNQYGFYEFYSSVYNPYCLSGLLNLADFAQDTQIKNLAAQAAQRLMISMLMLTNDHGVFYPTAGRNYPDKYIDPYNQNHNNLIYLLTGFGQVPVSSSAAGPYLVTSSIPVDTIINSWVPQLDTTFFNGHSLERGFVLNSAMSELDKVVFQWSSGAYFHPEVVSETVQLLIDSNLWGNTDFSLLEPLKSFATPQNAPALATTLNCISESSVICGETIHIFKHNSVTLSSLSGFWQGKVGFQQYPCVANVGTTAVFTASGPEVVNWNNRNPDNGNTHLPYVLQKKNIALIMYRPEPTSTLLPAFFDSKDVALYFVDSAYDQVVNDSLWLLGKQGNNYVAVRRSCIGIIDSVQACPTVGGQTWVIMVGDSLMYGSFANFQNIVHQSQFTEQWYVDTTQSLSVYDAKIVVDTTTLEYAWGVDTTLSTGINRLPGNESWKVYPNPANSVINIDHGSMNGNCFLKVFNINGQLVYSHWGGETTLAVSTQQFSEGIYAVQLIDASGISTTKRVIVTH